MKTKLNIKYLIFVIAISLIFGFLFNYLSETPLELIRHKKEITFVQDEDLNKTVEQSKEDNSDKNRAVNTRQAFKMFKSKNITFIDARDEWDFAAGHIKGAINIPEYNFESIYNKYSDMNKSKGIIVYCGSKDCNLAERVADKLKLKGFKEVYIYLDGWEVWHERNYPIEIKKED